jgi:tRNA threonylcarbamoyladenosine biosynthesis protein TsaB
MSIILAIETSSELASAALLHHGTMTSEEAVGVVTHSQSILPMVQSLLANAGIRLTDCDAIAFGSGPGSFTGVRTACGIAQGLAYGANLPVFPTITLLALAQACFEKTGARDVLTLLDARMGEVYWAQYRFEQTWTIVVPPTLSAPANVMPLGEVVACGNGMNAYATEFLPRTFFSDARKDFVPHATHIAQLGATAFTQGLAVSAKLAEPLYLRNKIALTTNERLEKAAKAAA